MTPEIAFLEAVRDLLLADEAVAAIVADRVLDEVPADRAPVTPPYVYVGPMARTRVTDTCATAWTMRMRLYAVSTGFGRRQAWEATDAVARALNGVEIDLPSPYEAVDPILVTQAADVIQSPAPKATFVDITVIIQEEQ